MAKTSTRASVSVPDFFARALAENEKAKAAFNVLSPSHKREYIKWLCEAKREVTRARRIETALTWLVDGKPQK